MSVPANQIPSHPAIAAAVAAAPPAARVAQDNQMIPGHPQVQAAIHAARNNPPAAAVNMGEDFSGDPGEDAGNPQADWFGAAATGAPTPERYHREDPSLVSSVPAAPLAGQVQPQPGQQPSYSDIDALLEGVQIPGEAQALPPQVPQGQPQPLVQPPQQQVPPLQQPQQQPVVQPQAPVAAAPPQFDAEAAQKAAIDQLMGRDYALSEADQRRLIAEPEAVIPRLAAQVHVNVVSDIGRRVGAIIPQLVNQIVEQRLEGMRRETEFFSRFPKLAHPAFRSIVEQSLGMVKAANPNISQEQLYQEGASYAAFRIRSQFRQGGAPQTVPGVPMAPQVPQMRAPVAPFVPMSPGAPSVPMAPQGGNPFADLANATDLFDW